MIILVGHAKAVSTRVLADTHGYVRLVEERSRAEEENP